MAAPSPPKKFLPACKTGRLRFTLLRHDTYKRREQSDGSWDCNRHCAKLLDASCTIDMTSLQKQLAAIAATSTHQLDLKAQKLAHGKSLLFEPRIAASQSFENIYLICYEGFRDLCALDPRFVQFSRSIFSEQSKVEDRTQMSQKENDKLNEVLEAFITMVGPRLLLKPAEKALEWLVRRFRCAIYQPNRDES